MQRILIVDDDRETCLFIAELLQQPDREFAMAHEAQHALELARAEPYALVISDINLNDDLTGLDVLRAFKQANPDGQVLLISGFGTLETAIDAVRAGAFDYISKPFDIGQVKTIVSRALTQAGSHVEPPAHARRDRPQGLIGRSAPLLEVYKQIARAADSQAPVLIIGESGTGKELVARAIHEHSRRSARPFVPVNCGAIAESLLESELFGHVRGAFTGAVSDTKGLFEQASGGTILLDEIGETTPALQVKLLRVLQDSEIRPVGGSRAIRLDIRVIAATNADLEKAVAEQRFRADLYYRLSVVVIRVPPLRERRDDIPLLTEEFLRRACSRAERQVELSPGALDVIAAFDWPGNVRQLENLIERVVLLAPGSTVQPDDLPAPLDPTHRSVATGFFRDLPTLDELERQYLQHVLEAVGGNRTRAAQVLGIDRRTLYRMAERFGLKLGGEES
jgi:DNA-binding NtrC family response regulator